MNGNNGANGPRVLFVDVNRALRAIDILRRSPTSAAAIQTYQDDFTRSNFHQLISVLETIVSLGRSKLREDVGLSLISQLLGASRELVKRSQSEVYGVQRAISSFRETYFDERAKIVRDILGVDDGTQHQEFVADGIERAAKDIKPTIDGLKWWKLPLAVDDITQVVSRAVEKAYTKQFENKVGLSRWYSSIVTDLDFKIRDRHEIAVIPYRPPLRFSVLVPFKDKRPSQLSPPKYSLPSPQKLTLPTLLTPYIPHRPIQPHPLLLLSNTPLPPALAHRPTYFPHKQITPRRPTPPPRYLLQ